MNGMISLSPGKFLNASIGPRSLVPVAFTRKRIDTFLKHAVLTNSVVHFYLHPHNFIFDASMLDKLDYLLAEATEYKINGKLKITTMNGEFNECTAI